MSKIATGNGTRVGGVILKQKKTDDILGIAFQDARSAAPTSSADFILYRRGSSLYVWDGSTETVLGGASAGGDTMDSAYNAGRTVTVDDGAFTLNGVDEDTAVLSVTGDGDSGGALISLSHTTNTRNDILGTGSTWKVTGQGAAEFQASVTTAAIAAYGAGGNANLTIDAKGTGTITIAGTSTGAVTITPALTATASVTITGTAASDVFTITAGDAVVTDGSLTITDDDNAVGLKLTNNTATTVGASAATGLVEFASTSLTTGTLLHLELTEGTLNGGHYLKCWDVTAGAAVFSVAENGDVTITGAGGANALTISNGDAVLSDGSITLTDADNAATLSVTNNTATTIGAAASGGVATLISTSLTTGALLNLQLTEGTLNGGWYVRAWDATAGAAVFSVGEDGKTTIAGAGGSDMFTVTAGDVVLSDGSITLTDADNAASVTVVNDTATTIGASAAAGLVRFASTSLTTGTLLHLELTEGTLNGGHYLKCWDVTGGSAVFSIAEDGDVSMNSATIGAKIILSGTETIAAGGTSTALSLSKTVHHIDADAGGDTFTLADGTAGQLMYITMESSTGTATITPANFASGTSITFNAAGDSVCLLFIDSKWYIVGGNSYAIV